MVWLGLYVGMYVLGCELCKSWSGDEDGLVREVSVVEVEGCGWS